ncbi:MAG: hypothetical protein Q8O99_05225 [bacterium]|nr:hypothetical protein [bacterium]
MTVESNTTTDYSSLRTEEAILLKMAQSLGAQDNAQQQRYISYLRIFAVNETFQQSIIRTYEAALE